MHYPNYLLRQDHSLPRLLPEDEAKPYAKFYYEGAHEPAFEIIKDVVAKQPIDPNLAIYPHEVEKLIDLSPIEAEVGYCLLPDGGTCSAMLTMMPDVTIDMARWYTRWYPQDNLRYVLWCPGAHLAATPDWVSEDIGCGLMEVYLKNYFTLEDLGVTQEMASPENHCLMLGGANWLLKHADDGPDTPPMRLTVVHYVRERDGGGLEWRSRFWIGYHLQNGKSQLQSWPLPDDEKLLEYARCFAMHNALEMTTRANALPRLYEEFKDSI